MKYHRNKILINSLNSSQFHHHISSIRLAIHSISVESNFHFSWSTREQSVEFGRSNGEMGCQISDINYQLSDIRHQTMVDMIIGSSECPTVRSWNTYPNRSTIVFSEAELSSTETQKLRRWELDRLNSHEDSLKSRTQTKNNEVARTTGDLDLNEEQSWLKLPHFKWIAIIFCSKRFDQRKKKWGLDRASSSAWISPIYLCPFFL